MILFADAGIPMLAVVWPVMWLAFLPVVVIESLVALKSLGLQFRRALAVTAAANAVSTLVGIPLTWFVLVVLELVLWGGGVHPIGTPWQAAITVCKEAAWLCPYENAIDWMVPVAAILLCVPFYFVSVLIEYFIVRRMVSNDGRPVRRFCWWANLWSYMALILFWVGCLLTSRYAV